MRYLRTVLTGGSLALGLLLGAVRSEAGIVTIDDFESDVLSPAYVQSNTLAVAGNDAVVSYNTTTNDGKLTYSFTSSTNNAVQTTLLRDDYSLSHDGDYVQLTVALPAFSGRTTDILGGLVLDSGSKSPTTTENIYLLQLVGDGSIRAQRNATTLVNTGSNKFTIGNDVILRITRNSSTTVTSSYSLDGGANFVTMNATPHVITGFNALGMYGGSARTRTPATLTYDNLLYFTPNVAATGDFDSDGDVDGADFIAWQTHYPTAAGGTLATGDADGDGDVDGIDFATWQASFPAAPAGSLVAVPEPTACTLFSIAMLGSALVSRWRRGFGQKP